MWKILLCPTLGLKGLAVPNCRATCKDTPGFPRRTTPSSFLICLYWVDSPIVLTRKNLNWSLRCFIFLTIKLFSKANQNVYKWLYLKSISWSSYFTIFSHAGMPLFVVLFFIVLYRYCRFRHLSLLASLCQASRLVSFFQWYFLTLCFCIIFCFSLTICQTCSLLLYLLWSSVISDLWCYSCHCFEVPQTAPM